MIDIKCSGEVANQCDNGMLIRPEPSANTANIVTNIQMS